MMTASDHLNGQQFYHGTVHAFEPGEVLTPAGAEAAGRNEHNDEPGYHDHVFFTPSKKDASMYAWGRAFNQPPERQSPVGRVYAVKPMGDYERDPGAHNKGGMRTREGMQVVKEVRQVNESDF